MDIQLLLRGCFLHLFIATFNVLVKITSSFSSWHYFRVLLQSYRSPDTSMEEFQFYSIRGTWFSFGCYSCPCLSQKYTGIAFSRWDISNEVSGLFIFSGPPFAEDIPPPWLKKWILCSLRNHYLLPVLRLRLVLRLGEICSYWRI